MRNLQKDIGAVAKAATAGSQLIVFFALVVSVSVLILFAGMGMLLNIYSSAFWLVIPIYLSSAFFIYWFPDNALSQTIRPAVTHPFHILLTVW